jgi:hypothetical protein
MSKLALILALVFGVALTMPAIAKAEVQNVKVSGDITLRGIYRDDYDLQQTNKDGSVTNQDEGGWYMSTVRVRIDADLTDNVAATIRLLNERDWDIEAAATTDIDVDLAYVTLKEMLYSPLTVTLGRQEIRLGDGMVVGMRYADPNSIGAINAITADDLSARKAFDGIVGVLDYDPWTVTLFTTKIDETLTTGEDQDKDLYGINVGYTFANNAEAEGYFVFYRDQGANVQLTKYSGSAINERRTFEDKYLYVIGTRGSVKPLANLTLKGEIAYQLGELQDTAVNSTDYSDSSTKDIDIEAWAIDLAGTYALNYAYSPVLGLKYAYRSGESVSWSGDYGQWDPVFEDQVNGVIANALTLGNASFQLNNTNMHIIGVSGSIVPMEDVKLTCDYYRYILDENLDTTNNISTIYKNDDDYGNEIDVGLTYDYTEDVQLGLLAAWFMPGDAFENTYDDTATELLGSVKVSF